MKVMSKMGISTAQSYCGAQIFEAVGLNKDVIEHYFTWTPSRISGIGLDVIAAEVKARHEHAFPERPMNGHTLDVGGHYQYRKEGEYHLFNPETIHKLQHACRSNNYGVFKEYSGLVNNQAKRLCTLRGLFELKFWTGSPEPSGLILPPVPIEEVDPVDAIMKRFKSGAMSYGSISQEAHETLAIAMNRIGGKSNTGEGGEDPARYSWTNEHGDSKNSSDQAGGVRPGSASPASTWSTPRSCRSRWPRAPSPARAASCPAARFIHGSPRSGTRRRAWA